MASLPTARFVRRLRIRGRVQGVGYRYWALREAQALKLDGWVRNRLDGSVEAVAAGPQPVVEALIAACGRGPDGARVESVEVEETSGIVATGFVQKPTV